MKNKIKLSAFCITLGSALLLSTPCYSQQHSHGPVYIKAGETTEQIIKKAASVTPSPRQYEWQKLEFTAFIHFGINTFDEVEWGTKNVDISKFNPAEIDVKQWVKVLKDAGAGIIILTTKHHDGFCLWPTKYKELNIAHTPFQNGKGDIVRDLSNACREAGVKFGVYLSPWDMHEDFYGSPAYNTFFLNQLTELLTNYGEIAEVWFDGANGEGPNGKKQVYDWNAYYKLIRKLQPKAVIAVSGPDVRWVGTESGYGRQTEWSVLPGNSSDQEAIAANSQQAQGDGAFIPRDLMDEDLGSRAKISKATSLVWYPAEIDVSIRPGWFYKKSEDKRVKSPYKLVDIYYNSVGLNGVLLLNVPPDKRGLICQNDVEALQGMRYLLDETFKTNFAGNCKATASSQKKGNEAEYMLDDNYDTYWTTDDTLSTASVEIVLNGKQTFDRAMLQENILVGQRIEKFHLEYWDGAQWNRFAEATTVGYKRLLRFPEITTDKIKLVIDQCRTNPTLSSFGVYKAPPEVTFNPGSCSFPDTMTVSLECNTDNSKIYYTLDGTKPTRQSTVYTGSIALDNTRSLSAIAIASDGKTSLPINAVYSKAKYAIEYKTECDKKYPGSGPYTLVDGVNGSAGYDDGKWQGFNGTDVDVVIDLGRVKNINKVSMNFLRDINSFLFLPVNIEFSVSNDNKEYAPLGKITNDENQNNKSVEIKSFSFDAKNISGRYIHIKAVNMGICPQWHKGAGDKAWLFCDEITVE